jgi:CheY-like chemotaxis protein
MISDLLQKVILELKPETKILKATSGVDAISKAAIIIPDLIFMDVNMPLMNGLECLEQMRKDSGTKLTPVVIFSNNFNTSTMLLCSLNNAEFVIKPESYSDMKDIVERFCVQHFK